MKSPGLSRYIPLLNLVPGYSRPVFQEDFVAGLIVAIMLVPQAMAYAMLAGLPPESGLYASMIPLVIYAVFGTSSSLAVGPVAIVSLMVAAALGPLAGDDLSRYMMLAATLAFMVGAIQLIMGLARVGFMVNFLSHPVLAGLCSAAAIVIGFSQLKHILGFTVPAGGHFYEQVSYVLRHVDDANPATVIIGAAGILILIYFKSFLAGHLEYFNLKSRFIVSLTKSGPLFAVLVCTAAVYLFRLNTLYGVAIVGSVPGGLPGFTLPVFDIQDMKALLPSAAAISFVGFMESISVAKALAAKKRQRVDPDQELIALGAANLGATLTGGFPVTGGFSRSVVNFNAGSRTVVSSIVTASLILLALLFLTPLFYYLPKAILASVIMAAVATLLDLKTLIHVWRYSRADSLSYVLTFLCVLVIGVDSGIVIGVCAALIMFVYRSSRPHAAVVGRIPGTEIYRNIKRHDVVTRPDVLALRIDENLFFANTRHLEETILSSIADNDELRYLIIVGTAINYIDASALETLLALAAEVDDAGVELHFAAIKGPVMDRLEKVGFDRQIGQDRFHMSTHDAMKAVMNKA